MKCNYFFNVIIYRLLVYITYLLSLLMLLMLIFNYLTANNMFFRLLICSTLKFDAKFDPDVSMVGWRMVTPFLLTDRRLFSNDDQTSANVNAIIYVHC